MKKYKAEWNYRQVIVFANALYQAKIKAIIKLKIPKKFQRNMKIECLLNGMEFE